MPPASSADAMVTRSWPPPYQAHGRRRQHCPSHLKQKVRVQQCWWPGLLPAAAQRAICSRAHRRASPTPAVQVLQEV